MKKILDMWLFRSKNWLERRAFQLIRLGALPAWAAYRRAAPQPQQWAYSRLVQANSERPPDAKPTAGWVQQHQSKWAGRVLQIARLYDKHKVLEVGCGQGLLAEMLQEQGLDVSANDVIDILDPAVRESGVHFDTADVCEKLPYADGEFELVFAVNAFEHFSEPARALDEMLRVLRPGGLLYLTFDPLYYSPWGLHAARRISLPYPQILFSKETIQRYVDESQDEIRHTYSEGSDTTKIGPPLNEYTLEEYRKIFKTRKDSFKMIAYTERISLDGVRIIRENPELFKAYAPSFESLIGSGIKLLGQKTGR
jgi:SAM-dependent methyltransferase